MTSRLYLVEQSALEVGGHYYAYTRTVAAAAKSIGLDVTILQNQRFRGDWQVEGADVVSAFRHTWSEAHQLWLRDWRPGQIVYDLHQAVLGKPPRAGDHVLFSTLSNAELQAVLDYLLALSPGDQYPTYHILLRYDPDDMRGSWDHYERLFRRVAESVLLQRILRLHTDTDLLTDAYARLTGLPFTTLPIPFAQDRLKARLAEGRAPSDPLVVTYLGDARLEKNFADIPDAISYLWNDYGRTGRVRFVLQSNFNVEGGEAGMLQAVQRLAQMPPSIIRLIERPLTTDEYLDILAAADIVLVPYNARRYQFRSSGILIEAMAAGKPVITTRGSWMASQVSHEHAVVFSQGSDLGLAIKTAIDDFPRLKTGAEALAPSTMKTASGENFVRALLASSRDNLRPKLRGPRVLYIIDGQTLILRNGAGVVALRRLAYLVNAGYQVTVLALMRNQSLSAEQIETWTLEVGERLAGFELEKIFIASVSRLSTEIWGQKQQRQTSWQSIATEIDAVSRFDINLDFVNHIRLCRPDVLFVNYITNHIILEKLGLHDIPIVCEMLDIRSFQKAIYANRRVSSDDLTTELNLLSQCAHLISLSQPETDYINQLLPNVPISTVGVFPDIPALGVRALAGVRNLAEVVSSCGPISAKYKWEITETSERSPGSIRLAQLNHIDLLYVGSNNLSNISGIQWFLDAVYIPHLAPAGITLIVAGSIGEWSGWPTHENLFIVGRLDRLSPLYAAAKIVVAPIIEGAGVVVKTVEALAYGRPIVATAKALRGMESVPDGVIIADTIEATCLAIHQLLSSEQIRLEKGAAVRRTARQISDPNLHATLLDCIFIKLLGDGALRSPQRPELPADEDLRGWTPVIERVNGLIMNWLENEPLEDVALNALSRHPRNEVESTLRGVIRALIVDRDAPSLSTERRVKLAAAGRRPGEAEITFRVIVSALDVIEPPQSAYPATIAKAEVVFNTLYPISLAQINIGMPALWTQLEQPAIVLEATHSSRIRTALKLDYSNSLARLSCATLTAEDSLQTALIFQTIVLNDAEHETRLNGAGSIFLSRNVASKSGSAFTFQIPELYSPFSHSRVVDIIVDATQSLRIDVEFDGIRALPKRFQRSSVQVWRFYLTNRSINPIMVSINVNSGTGVLRQIIHYISLGEDFEDVLAAIDQLFALAPANMGEDAAQTYDDSQDILEELKNALEQQRTIPRLRALSIRQNLGEDLDTGVSRLRDRGSKVSSADIYNSRLADVLDANRLIKQPPATVSEGRLIASRGLTMEVHATLAPETDAVQTRCLLDDLEAPRLQIDNQRVIWRVDGRPPAPTDSWMRRVRFTNAAGLSIQPNAASATFRFVAAQDRATGRSFVNLSNSYEPEIYNADVGLVWTGPNTIARFTVPLAITAAGQLSINLANVGDNWREDDLIVSLNGLPLTIAIEYEGSGAHIIADFPPDSLGLLSTELALVVARLSSPPGETRQLGVALNWIELRLPLDL